MTDTDARTAAPAPSTDRKLLGLISFIAGAVGVVLPSLFTLSVPFLVRSNVSSYTLLSVLGIGSTVLALVLGLAALVIGLIVLLKKDAPRGFAAAGAALGGAQVVTALISFGQTAMLNFI